MILDLKATCKENTGKRNETCINMYSLLDTQNYKKFKINLSNAQLIY